MSLGLFNSHIFEHQSFYFELRLLQTKDVAAFHSFIFKNSGEFNVAFPVTTAEILKGVQSTKHWIAQKLDDEALNRNRILVLIKRDTHEILGYFSAFGFDWRVPKCEIAWMLDTDWRGQGLATYIVGKGIHHLLQQGKLEKIICRIDHSNIKSLSLAARLGFTSEAMHRKDFRNGNDDLVDVEYMAIWR